MLLVNIRDDGPVYINENHILRVRQYAPGWSEIHTTDGEHWVVSGDAPDLARDVETGRK